MASLANLYMNRFLKHWRMTGRGKAFQAHVVNYADDFVILSRGHAAYSRRARRMRYGCHAGRAVEAFPSTR